MPNVQPTIPALVAAAQADIASRLDGADARLRRNALNADAVAWGAGLDGVYTEIANLFQMAFPQTSKGVYLDLHAARQNVFRKLPSAAAGPATAAGTNGLIFGAGVTMKRTDGALFITTSDVEIADGAATLSIAACLAGSAGNTDAGTVLTIVNPIPGISSSVTVSGDGLANGTDKEKDPALLGRLMEVWQEQPQGGAAWDYIERALEVPGVTRAWVFPNWGGLGTVSVSFVMDDQAGTIFPDGDSVALVQAHLTDLSWKPANAAVSTFAPVAAPCNFTIHLNPDTAALRTAVEDALAALFTNEQSVGGALLPPDGSETAGLIPLGHMWSAIEGAVGNGDADLDSPEADFQAPNGQLPTLGTVTFV